MGGGGDPESRRRKSGRPPRVLARSGVETRPGQSSVSQESKPHRVIGRAAGLKTHEDFSRTDIVLLLLSVTIMRIIDRRRGRGPTMQDGPSEAAGRCGGLQ